MKNTPVEKKTHQLPGLNEYQRLTELRAVSASMRSSSFLFPPYFSSFKTRVHISNFCEKLKRRTRHGWVPFISVLCDVVSIKLFYDTLALRGNIFSFIKKQRKGITSKRPYFIVIIIPSLINIKANIIKFAVFQYCERRVDFEHNVTVSWAKTANFFIMYVLNYLEVVWLREILKGVRKSICSTCFVNFQLFYKVKLNILLEKT